MTTTDNPFLDDNFAKYVGIELIDSGNGTASAQLEILACHLNGAGLVHGGAVFTLAAWTMAVAANTRYPLSVGVNAAITWLRPAAAGTLIARAVEIAASGRVSTWQVKVTDQDGQTVAVLQGSACRKDSHGNPHGRQ